MFKALAGPARQPAGLAYTTLGAMHKYSICHAVSSRSIWRHWTGGEGGSRSLSTQPRRTQVRAAHFDHSSQVQEGSRVGRGNCRAARRGVHSDARLRSSGTVPQLGWVPFKLASMRRVPASPVSYAHVLSEGPLR